MKEGDPLGCTPLRYSAIFCNKRSLALIGRSLGLIWPGNGGVASPRRPFRQEPVDGSARRKGNGYDNATMESFWSTLKLELVYRGLFLTRAQARTQIFDYIEVFYNRQRAHSALDCNSPIDFETLYN
jgi:transposase InsO family protein